MQRVRKAVITAAGRGTRMFPATRAIQKEMLPLVDVDGFAKPAIQLIIEEALESGIDQVCLVVNAQNRSQIEPYFAEPSQSELDSLSSKPALRAQAERIGEIGRRLTLVEQPSPEGYGHAVWCTRDFVGDEPFLLMLGDHIYLSNTDVPCARQVLDVFETHGAGVSSVDRTSADQLHLYGTVRGPAIAPQIYEIEHIFEKPNHDYASEHLVVEGLPANTYLCFFGMHVFKPSIFDSLQQAIDNNLRDSGEIQLTSAQERLRESGERFVACEVNGTRHDIGIPAGFIETQAALASRINQR